MRALVYEEYGGPEVLHIGDVPEPSAGPGQVRIAVRAAGLNPLDWKLRQGLMSGGQPLAAPAVPGLDAAGVVDQVGEGVADVAVGDEVFGNGSGAFAEYAVLDVWATKPEALSWEQAAALPVGAETSARILALVTVASGDTIVVDGAAGGVGSLLTQIAVKRGLRVIGTASAANHDFLTEIGAVPTTYGAGLVERVRALAPEGVRAAADTVGKGSVPDLVTLTGDPRQVVTIADFGAGAHGVHVTSGAEGERAWGILPEVAQWLAAGEIVVPVETLPLADGARAHSLSQEGHVRGKLVVTP